MTAPDPDILVLARRIDPGDLRRLLERHFPDMVKFVADVARGIIAVGGELHADAEQTLLAGGSRQADLWGANYYPDRPEDECVEYTALINIRPARGNRGMEIADEAVRDKVRELAFALLGRGREA